MMTVTYFHTNRFPSDMSKTKKPARRRSSRRKTAPLVANGVGATAAGMALWLLSLMMEARGGLPPIASKALLAPAWMAIGIGIALLVLHVLEKRRTQAEADMLLRQHSTFLEPMPRLKRPAKPGGGRSRSASSRTSVAGPS
jgi:hypothetical protein